MRLPLQHRNERSALEVKMTPMIDVIFLLLIFFVCTASFRAVEEVLPTNLQLPGTLESEAPPEELVDLDEIVVKVLWDEGRPRWRINERECGALEEVGGVLGSVARLKNDLPVILDVDGSVPLEHVIDVYDVCRRAGLRRIQFAASEKV